MKHTFLRRRFGLTHRRTLWICYCFSHPDIRTPSRLSGRNSNIFLMYVYESDQTDVAKKCVSLNVFCEQWTVAIQMISIFSWCAPVSVEWQKVSGIVGRRFSKESLEIPVKAVCAHFSILAQCRSLVSDQRHYNKGWFHELPYLQVLFNKQLASIDS